MRCKKTGFFKYLFVSGAAENLLVGLAAMFVGYTFINHEYGQRILSSALDSVSCGMIFISYGFVKLSLSDRNVFPRVEAVASTIGIWLWTSLFLSRLQVNAEAATLALVFPIVFEVLSLALTINVIKGYQCLNKHPPSNLVKR